MSTNDPEDPLLREVIVAMDGVSIPVFDMQSTGFFSKLFKRPPDPVFAVESRRIIRVESEQVPKRIMKHFKQLQSTLTMLSFQHNWYATIPTMGPLAIGMMSMATSSGLSSFLAVRTVKRVDGQIVDGGYHGFNTYLDAGEVLVTMSQANLYKPRPGIFRVMVNKDDPEQMLREHRRRMREYRVAPVDPADIVEFVRRHNWLDVDDAIEQELLRGASKADISRIKGLSKR